MNHLLCIDIGTSYLKAAIVTRDGAILEKGRAPLSLFESDGYTCIEPAEWLPALRKICLGFKSLGGIAALSVTGNGPSLIAVSRGQLALKPALSWMDRSCASEARTIGELAGKPYDPSFYLAKALRLARVFGLDEIWRFFSGPEYLAFILGAEPASYLPSEGYEPFIWNSPFHEALGLPASLFPPYAGPGTVIGHTKQTATGLPAGIPIIASYPDFLAAIAGTSCIEPGRICDRTGSSETLNACSSGYDDTDRLLRLPHLVPDYWNLSGGVSTSGKAIDWFCSLQGSDYALENFIEDSTRAAFDSGLLFLPYLHGERAPLWNPKLRAMFLGLEARHTRRDLARAVLEGVIFGLRYTHDTMMRLNQPRFPLRTSGYLADIPAINQLKADILRTAVENGIHAEGELLGCAAACLLGLGEARSIAAACGSIFVPYNRYEPGPDDRYEEKYQAFLAALSFATKATERGVSA